MPHDEVTRPGLRPHPILKDYYQDEIGRRKKVDSMFDASASHYDWITDMMSFGSGRWYRKDVLKRAGCKPGSKVLDVGAGTGVISALAQDMVGDEGEVVALDPSRGMLNEAVKRGVRKTIQGLGEALPFPDDYFDLLTMGYALRHVSDLRRTFEEYHRVLKPGGKVLLLEITRPTSPLPTFLLKVYLKGIVPNVARVFRRSIDAKILFEYYWDTIESCVPPASILDALGQAGFHNPNRDIIFGLFSEYSAIVHSDDSDELDIAHGRTGESGV